jgi:hypothetical protein
MTKNRGLSQGRAPVLRLKTRHDLKNCCQLLNNQPLGELPVPAHKLKTVQPLRVAPSAFAVTMTGVWKTSKVATMPDVSRDTLVSDQTIKE